MSNNEIQLYSPHTDLVMARLRSPKMKDTPEPEAQAKLAPMIQAVGLIQGRKLDEDTVGLLAALVVAEARMEPLTADLTWEEIGKALQGGAFGKYGEVYRINAASIYGMLLNYAESEEKADLTRKVRSIRDNEARKRQEKVAKFLEEHIDYSKIVLKNYIDNKQTVKAYENDK